MVELELSLQSKQDEVTGLLAVVKTGGSGDSDSAALAAAQLQLDSARASEVSGRRSSNITR